MGCVNEKMVDIHEAGDDAVESAAFVVQVLARAATAFLACISAHESSVSCMYGCVGVGSW